MRDMTNMVLSRASLFRFDGEVAKEDGNIDSNSGNNSNRSNDDDDGLHGRDLLIQVVSWNAGDEKTGNDGDDDDGNNDDEDEDTKKRKRCAEDLGAYVIRAFGVTKQGTSVAVRLHQFTPFFYVRLPERATRTEAAQAARNVTRYLEGYGGGGMCGLLDVVPYRKGEFWGFTDGTQFDFLRLSFGSEGGMRRMASRLQGRPEHRVQGMGNIELKVYESNIDPLLRFFHVRDLRPAGWLRIPGTRIERNMRPETTCQVDLSSRWTNATADACEDLAPIVMASFDIECNSAHGDFPVASKDYRRLGIDLEEAWERGGIRACTNDYEAKRMLTECMRTAFGLSADLDRIRMSALHLKARPKDVRRLEGAIQAAVDDVYVAVSSVTPPVALAADATAGGSNARLERVVHVLNAAFGSSWPLKGDEIIQIGTTINLYGQSECCARFVHVLGSCGPVEGAELYTFDDEAAMLVSWVELVRALDPDVVMGFNVFGFDFDYMHKRATELLGGKARDARFCRLGRLLDRPSAMVEQKLSSSALGENVLKYMDLHGRVLVDIMKIVQREHKLDSYKLDAVAHHFVGLNKHDISPNDIFRLQRGTADDRRIIAEYCIQDCALCNQLAAKLEIVANNAGMANVCSVPLSFIFMRGQGVKIFSLVAKQCRADGLLIPTKARVKEGEEIVVDDDGEGYEGAIVLDPEVGMYLDQPVSVLDYNSLYPSSMISENISHDSLVLDLPRYGSLAGVRYVDVAYDTYAGKGDDKHKVGERVCRYAQGTTNEGDRKAVLPRILQRLLGERKATRKRIGHMRAFDDTGVALAAGEHDKAKGTIGDVLVPPGARIEPAYNAFQRAVLDGLQLAYKVTANSLYGQMGARTSQLYLKPVAACTTAVGRAMIQKAKAHIEGTCGGRVVYGDTDSIFIVFKLPEGATPRDTLASSIAQGQAASRSIKPLLKPPHNLEYEKTMFPLILLSKKRYVGLLYEDNPDAVPTLKSMGIALKRRDYAPVVKRIYGGVIDIILRDRDMPKAVGFLHQSLVEMSEGKCDLQELVISKTLRSYYKMPHQIAHWVLARRMFERDPGSAPQANDRVPYVFVETTKKDALMGDRIEHVDHVRKHPDTLKVDTKTYIENQIMKPCLQLLSIALEQLPGYVYDPELSGTIAFDALLRAKAGNATKARERLDTLREREVERLIFAPILAMPVFRQRDNRCAGQTEIDSFFTRTVRTPPMNSPGNPGGSSSKPGGGSNPKPGSSSNPGGSSSSNNNNNNNNNNSRSGKDAATIAAIIEAASKLPCKKKKKKSSATSLLLPTKPSASIDVMIKKMQQRHLDTKPE
jgi:DNA polymerase elongation subunit (family B)